jgi:hypothetical protein
MPIEWKGDSKMRCTLYKGKIFKKKPIKINKEIIDSIKELISEPKTKEYTK